jgi:hypothetical protein
MSPEETPDKPLTGAPMEPPEETIRRLDELNKEAARLLKLTERWSDKNEQKKEEKEEPKKVEPPKSAPPKPEKIADDEALIAKEKSELEIAFANIKKQIAMFKDAKKNLNSLNPASLAKLQKDLDDFPAFLNRERPALDKVNVQTDAGKQFRFGLKKELYVYLNKEFADIYEAVDDAQRKIPASKPPQSDPPKDSAPPRSVPPTQKPPVDLPPPPSMPPPLPPPPPTPEPKADAKETKPVPKAPEEKKNSQAVREILWRWRTLAGHTDKAWCEMTGLNQADLYRSELDERPIILKNVSPQSKLEYAKILVDGDTQKGLRGFLQTEAGAIQQLIARHNEMSPATKKEIFGRIQSLQAKWTEAWKELGRVAPPFVELPTVTPAGKIESFGRPLAPLPPREYDDLEQIEDSEKFYNEFMERRARTEKAQQNFLRLYKDTDMTDGSLRNKLATAANEFLLALKAEKSATKIALEQWKAKETKQKVSGVEQRIERDAMRRLPHDELEARSRWLLQEIEMLNRFDEEMRKQGIEPPKKIKPPEEPKPVEKMPPPQEILTVESLYATAENLFSSKKYKIDYLALPTGEAYLYISLPDTNRPEACRLYFYQRDNLLQQVAYLKGDAITILNNFQPLGRGISAKDLEAFVADIEEKYQWKEKVKKWEEQQKKPDEIQTPKKKQEEKIEETPDVPPPVPESIPKKVAPKPRN